MSKLYPPVIEGTIPAFNGTTLVVPFSMNRSVSKADIAGFSVKVKTIQSNTYVVTIDNGILDNGCARFDISGLWEPQPGQYYKLQLAYKGKDSNIGYYSTVGVVKYTSINNSNLTIEGLDASARNIFKHEYTGVYEHGADPVEKVYQYRFILYKDDEIDTDSGWLLHNAIADAATDTSVDTYEFFDDLEEDGDYSVQYQVITTNLLTLQTPIYPLIPMPEFEATINFDFSAKLNADNGYIQFSLIGEKDSVGEEKTIGGKFKIYRSNIKTPRRWEPIFNFVLQNEVPSKINWLKDFTVEHGETYKYKICQYNDAGILTTGAYTEEIYVDFEDMFLFDGVRQLKVQFNPKVASFKNDILESKLDTIGSQYPFFFRNGHVHYKEFPISGLISYWVDDEQLFKPLEEMYLDDENLVRNSTPSEDELDKRHPEWTQDNWGKGQDYVYDYHFKTKNLLNYNMAAEKKFKLDVLEWLTNGKPKLFRSPAEGNYIVRLMNTSLTPNDTLSRMIHTFQCTAYEIDALTYRNLSMYGFLNGGMSNGNENNDGIDYILNDEPRLRFKTVRLKDFDTTQATVNVLQDTLGLENISEIQSLFIEDCEYGDIFYIDGQEVHIGVTQSYNIDNLHPIKSVVFKPQEIAAISRGTSPFADVDDQPQITFSYFANFTSNTLFDNISELLVGNEPNLQIMGSATNFNTQNLINDIQHNQVQGNSILTNEKINVLDYPYVSFERVPTEEIYTSLDLNRYTESQLNELALNDNFDKVFTFDKTGWGKMHDISSSTLGNIGEQTSDFVKGSPYYLFYIKPVTFSNADFYTKDLGNMEWEMWKAVDAYQDKTLIREYTNIKSWRRSRSGSLVENGQVYYTLSDPEIIANDNQFFRPTEEKYEAIIREYNINSEQTRNIFWTYFKYKYYISVYMNGFLAKNLIGYYPTKDIKLEDDKKYYQLIDPNDEETIDEFHDNIQKHYEEIYKYLDKETGQYKWSRNDEEINTVYQNGKLYFADRLSDESLEEQYCIVYEHSSIQEIDSDMLFNAGLWERTEDYTKLAFLYDFDEHSFDDVWYLCYDGQNITFHKVDTDDEDNLADKYKTMVFINTGHLTGLDKDTMESLKSSAIDVADTLQPVVYYDLEELTDIYMGYEVLCNVSYNSMQKAYRFEDADETLRQNKQNYLSALNKYYELIDGYNNLADPDPTEYIYNGMPLRQYIENAYKTYIDSVNNYIVEWRKENEINEY